MTESDQSVLGSRRKFLVGAGAVGASALAGCIGETGGGSGETTTESNGSSESQGLSGDITITGSSTVYPVSVAMAEEFQKKHSKLSISVDSTGSGGGFKNHFCPGNSDINGASRPIKDSEVEQCSDNDVNPKEFQIAGDALTV